jgi:hypothetical protein
MGFSTNFPAIKPSLLLDFANTKALDPRITFTRATTATYYDGVTTAMAEQNLLLYSQAFDDATWAKLGGSATANTSVAPDGTTTAETLTANGTNGIHAFRQTQAASSVGKTVSVYAKAGTGTLMQILFDADVAPFANFDLSGGTVGTVGSGVTASIVDVGNGWYRCVCTTTSTIATNVYFALSNSSSASRYPSYTSSDTLLLWGAQAENRSSVTAYTATTTQAITNYIPVLLTAAAGVARFDHNPITDESLGLLIEEQRTNLFTRSEEFDNAAWTKTNSSIIANTIIAPDGTLTGDKVLENSTNTQHFVRQNLTVSAAAHTLSFYAKAAERTVAWASVDGGSNTRWFDLSAGTTGGSSGGSGSSTITLVGNGWYRCTYTYTFSGTSSPTFIGPALNSTTTSYAGDSFNGVYIWGAQFEAGAFATSYIPTVAAQVTRNADAASMTGTNFSSWYSAPEGTVYTEFQLTSGNGAGNNANIVALEGAGGLNMTVHRDSAAGWRYRTNLANLNISGVSDTLSNKIVFAYATSSYPFVASGGAVQLNTGVGVAPVTTSLVIGGGSNYALSRAINGTIRKIAYYPIRVTNAHLQGLTTV